MAEVDLSDGRIAAGQTGGPATAARAFVELPNGDVVEFPAGMTTVEMNDAIEKHLAGGSNASPLHKFRLRYPEYDDLSDAVLADKLYQKHYSDMPRGDFDARMGLTSVDDITMPDEPLSATPSRDFSTRDFQIGAQASGKALADLAGLAGDASTGAVNLTLAGADKAAYGAGKAWNFINPFDQFDAPELGIDYRFPPSPVGSDAISDIFSQGMTAVGVPPIEQSEMTPGERMAYNVSRFGAQGVTAGAGLARAALKETGKRAPALADVFLRPYVENAGRAVAVDTTAGAGSGAALTLAHDLLPDAAQGPLSDFLAMLTGGVAGATAASLTSAPRQTVRAFERSLPDPNFKVDITKGDLPMSRRTMDRAAEFAQNTATDPKKAAETIGHVTADRVSRGEPVPTAGVASGDIGLAAAERGARLRDPVPFQESDQRLFDAAQERVVGLRDEAADPEKATAYAGRVATTRREAAQRGVNKAEGDLVAVQTARKDKADELAAARGTGERASEAMDTIARGTLETEQRRSNQLFRAIDPDGTVVIDAKPLAEIVSKIRNSVPDTVPASEVLPEIWLQRWEAVGKGDTTTFKELSGARPFLSSAIAQAEKSDNHAFAKSLRAMKRHIDDVSEALVARGDEAGDRAQAE